MTYFHLIHYNMKLPKDRHSTGLTQFFLGSFLHEKPGGQFDSGLCEGGAESGAHRSPRSNPIRPGEIQSAGDGEGLEKMWLEYKYGISGVDSHGKPMFFVGDGAPLEL